MADENELGPRQRGHKGNEAFPSRVIVPVPDDPGHRDTSDEEAGIGGITRKADGDKPLTDNGHDGDREKRWGISEE